MAKPSTKIAWTPSGAAVVDPGSTKKAAGWDPGEKPPAQWFNWLFKWISAWIEYVDGLAGESLTWTSRQTFNGGATVPAPTVGTDAATMTYVDTSVAGKAAAPGAWTNCTSDGGADGIANIQARIEAGNVVRLRGSVFPAGGATTASHVAGYYLFRLPAGMRPANATVIGIGAQAGSTKTVKVFTLGFDGYVFCESSLASGEFVYVSGISFGIA